VSTSASKQLLIAASLANLPFGTIYAFSVLLKPMESALSLQRADMTLVFGLASIVLTAGMNIAPSLYRHLSIPRLITAASLVAATGLALTAVAESKIGLIFSYSVLFGLGGGIVFTSVQQLVNQFDFPNRGLINGYVVSLYPLGAMFGAPLMGWSIESIGLRQTLGLLAAVIGCSGVFASFLIRHTAKQGRQHKHPAMAPERMTQWPLFLRLSAVFTLAASAGLMVMSQAAGIMQAYGAGLGSALGATTLITAAIAAARIGGGWLIDRFALPHVMAAAQLWALCGAVLLSLWPSAQSALPGLAMIGMGYGLISGASAGAIAQAWPQSAFGLVASRLYIGWCLAAICLPVIAAGLYDASGNYRHAVLIAGAVNLLAMGLALRLPSLGKKAA
jgi:MFS transporter, OFA family, oxalate/formate antiporter